MADKSLTTVRLYNLDLGRFEVQDFAARRPEIVESLLERVEAIRDDVARDPVE